MPFTLSSFTRLEHLTICADLEVTSDGLHFLIILPVTHLITTAPVLKHLKFAFKFWFDTRFVFPKPQNISAPPWFISLPNVVPRPSLCVLVPSVTRITVWKPRFLK